MDIFGIAQAMKGMAYTYFQSARRAGRTTALIESLKSGDQVCFASSQEAHRVQVLCRERGIEITICVISPKQPDKLFNQARAQGRFIFDHLWVEQYYLHRIEQASLDIDHFQQCNSGRPA